MISPERVMENVKYFNKLYKDGVSPEEIRHKISSFEYVNQWGTKCKPHDYFQIIPLDWKKHLNPKIFTNL